MLGFQERCKSTLVALEGTLGFARALGRKTQPRHLSSQHRDQLQVLVAPVLLARLAPDGAQWCAQPRPKCSPPEDRAQ